MCSPFQLNQKNSSKTFLGKNYPQNRNKRFTEKIVYFFVFFLEKSNSAIVQLNSEFKYCIFVYLWYCMCGLSNALRGK